MIHPEKTVPNNQKPLSAHPNMALVKDNNALSAPVSAGAEVAMTETFANTDVDTRSIESLSAAQILFDVVTTAVDAHNGPHLEQTFVQRVAYRFFGGRNRRDKKFMCDLHEQAKQTAIDMQTRDDESLSVQFEQTRKSSHLSLVDQKTQQILNVSKMGSQDIAYSFTGQGTASFASNDNTVDISQIGYTTKEGLQLFGMTVDNKGQTTYHYTKRIGCMKWRDANKVIKKLNKDSDLNSNYGKASFPTDHRTKTNELNMLFENKEALGIVDDFIYGESLMVLHSRVLVCKEGWQGDQGKHDDVYHVEAAAFAVWRVNHRMI